MSGSHIESMEVGEPAEQRRGNQAGGRAGGPAAWIQGNAPMSYVLVVLLVLTVPFALYMLLKGGGGGNDDTTTPAPSDPVEPAADSKACEVLQQSLHCSTCSSDETSCSACADSHELVDGVCTFSCSDELKAAHCARCTYPLDNACSQCEKGYKSVGGQCYKPSDCTAEQTEEGCTECAGVDQCLACAPSHKYRFGQCTYRCSSDQKKSGCALCSEEKGCLSCLETYVYSDQNGKGSCEKPSGPTMNEFYIYRAKNSHTVSDSSFNAGNAGGVMWYLHNEVIAIDKCGECTPGGGCTRKYGIDRIARYRVTMKNTQEVFDAGRQGQFGPFRPMDKGQCTWGGDDKDACKRETWDKYGYVVGCQPQDIFRYFYPESVWFSFPDKCPSQDHQHQTKQCEAEEPGGRCDEPNGTRTCTFHIEGQEKEQYIMVDDLVGIKGGYKKFCMKGGIEYNSTDESQATVDFWKGFEDINSCAVRKHHMLRLFKEKYPQSEDLPDPECDGF